MKKITLLVVILFTILGYSQDELGKIKLYLNENKTTWNLNNQDIQELFIESELSSESTGIHNYFIKQKYQGIELFNSTSNFWIKNDRVINGGQGLINGISQKVNTTNPSLSVLAALTSAKNKLDIQSAGNHEIIENVNNKNFKISNAPEEEPIVAKLVYQLTSDNLLRLSWDFTIPTVDHKHLWSVRIDAVDGKMLAKHDNVISCSFAKHNHNCEFAQEQIDNKFTNEFFKAPTTSLAQVLGGSYRVIPYNIESPNHAARQLIANPENANASPKGWHDINNLISNLPANKFTYLRGNNTWTRADYGDVEPTVHSSVSTENGYSPDGGTALSFDFTYGGTSAQPQSYINAATTNLFYMNNMMHDVWYQYGFNEANGNFQKDNYGKGGTSSINGDAVWSDAQDGSTKATPDLNNANFSTPPDGTRPRMQMYLWNVSPPIFPLTINSPADIAGPRQGRNNAFNPGNVPLPIAPAMIQANLVLYDDGTPDIGQTDNADACGPAVNAAALNGKIAVIRRSLAEAAGGSPCPFTEKVKNAQNAGAIAAIIVNNVDESDGVPAEISMSGADATITIPAISLTKAIGYPLIARIKVETVNGKLQLGEPPFVNSDGDFDNGIIAHEYGHGISNRLTGGPANTSCLQNAEQMGEGWSDWFTLMMQLKAGDVGTSPRSIGSFAVGQPTTGLGIRTYRYCTDMSINPVTFAFSNTDAQHTRGELMASVLWDLNWAYIQKYGFSSNVLTGTAGNNKVMRLVIDGLKLQPCSPTTIEFRDALLAAEQATSNGADNCLIKEVFRRRGMGLNATSGSRDNALDQVADFTAFPAGPNCTALANENFDKVNNFNIYPNPTNGELNINIPNYNGKISIVVIDINGRIVSEIKNADFNAEKTINISSLQSGLYIVKVASDTFNYNKKIIKN